MKITICLGFFNPCPPVLGGAAEKMWYGLGKTFAEQGSSVCIISRTWSELPDIECHGRLRHMRLKGYSHQKKLWKNLLLDAWWSFKVLFHLPTSDITITNCVLLPVLASMRRKSGSVIVSLGRQPKGQMNLYRHVSRIHVPSQSMRNAVEKQTPQLKDKIVVIPCATDLTPFFSAANDRKKADTIRIGYIGRIHSEKGLDVLISAVDLLMDIPDLPRWELHLRGPSRVSEGGEGEDYLNHLRKLGNRLQQNGKIFFHDPIYQPDTLARAYAELDIFCYPSLAEAGESFGLAPVEAMASGATVITSDLPCFQEFLQEGQTGLIFSHNKPSRVEELATRIETLLRNTELRQKLAAAGQSIAAQFDLKPIAIRHLNDFENLIKLRFNS